MPWRRVWRCSLLLCAIVSLALTAEAWRIESAAAPFLSGSTADLPVTSVALVLGCSSHLPDGRRNLFFERRMVAAAELFHAGKVSYLLVSGDNSRVDYDEPSAMRDALVARGVPPSRIVRDHAGFRTLDSVLRAKLVYGLRELIVVSQRFHNERAVYLARAHGLRAYGYDAPDVEGAAGARARLREVLSRLMAVLDVRVLGSRPRFSGPPEPLLCRRVAGALGSPGPCEKLATGDLTAPMRPPCREAVSLPWGPCLP